MRAVIYEDCRCHLHPHFGVLSSSSWSSAPISEHSRLHKLTPLWTIPRTHSRCVRPRLWGQRSSSIVRSHVRLGRPARRRQSAGGRLMAARRMRE